MATNGTSCTQNDNICCTHLHIYNFINNLSNTQVYRSKYDRPMTNDIAADVTKEYSRIIETVSRNYIQLN